MADEPVDIVLQHLIAIRADITAIRARLDGMDKRLEQLEYGQTVGRRLDLAIIISPAFLLVKKRKHFLTVGYADDEGKQQALVFRVDKNGIRAILASLEARTGHRQRRSHQARQQNSRQPNIQHDEAKIGGDFFRMAGR